MTSVSLSNINKYFQERKNLKRNETIFFPNNKFLYAFIISLQIIPILIVGIVNYKIFFERIIVLLNSIMQLKFVTLILFIYGFFLLETSSRHIAVYNGNLIQRSYFIKEERIKISNIRDCKISTGRKRGEAIVNCKIVGNKKDDIININMIAYKSDSIKKITELIGFPNMIKK